MRARQGHDGHRRLFQGSNTNTRNITSYIGEWEKVDLSFHLQEIVCDKFLLWEAGRISNESRKGGRGQTMQVVMGDSGNLGLCIGTVGSYPSVSFSRYWGF